MTRSTSAVVLLLAAPLASARPLPAPLTYAKPTAAGVLVQLGDPVEEAKITDSAVVAAFRTVREKYAKSGLYRESGELVWELHAPYAPIDNVFAASDGVHLARLEGDWWIERDYPSDTNRLPADEEAKQLAAPAVGFYANGKLVRTHPVRELLTNPADLKHSPRFVLWAAGAVLKGDGQFVVLTQDATRTIFDPTGNVVARDRVGLNNPLLTKVLVASGAFAALILGAWAWFAFGRKPA
jgi:hypothetical protein